MQAKMDSMYLNQVWTLVDCPKGMVPIGTSGPTRERLVCIAG